MTPLLPYSTEMSRDPDDDRVTSFQYRNTFLSSDLPTSDFDDEYPTPRPLRSLKRDFTAFSDDSSAPKKKGRVKFSIVNYTLDSARRIINEAVEESRTSIDLSDQNLTMLPNDIRDLKFIVSASQAGSFNTNIELFLTKNRLTTLPESLFEVENLAFLGVSQNRLTELSRSVSKLQNLRSLNIGLNQIEFFPASLLTLKNLETLIFASSHVPVSPARRMSAKHGATMDPETRTVITTRRSPLTRNARVPALTELCMRCIATDPYFQDASEFINSLPIPNYLIDAIKRPQVCDTCSDLICDIYATREETWNGFARTAGLPIRRVLCGPNCLDRAP